MPAMGRWLTPAPGAGKGEAARSPGGCTGSGPAAGVGSRPPVFSPEEGQGGEIKSPPVPKGTEGRGRRLTFPRDVGGPEERSPGAGGARQPRWLPGAPRRAEGRHGQASASKALEIRAKTQGTAPGRTGGRTDRRGRGRLERGQPVLLSVGVLLGGFYFLAPLRAKR